MSCQKMGASSFEILAGKECWPGEMNVRRISQTAQAIRKIRARLGFSQEDFAQWLGLSVRNVTCWEAGNVKPTRMARRLIFDLLREEIEGLKNLPPASRR
jgi:DNA-binding XRE family transcriptional regulator